MRQLHATVRQEKEANEWDYIISRIGRLESNFYDPIEIEIDDLVPMILIFILCLRHNTFA